MSMSVIPFVLRILWVGTIGALPSGSSLQPGDLIVSRLIDTDPAGGQILRIDPHTGSQTVISSGGLLGNPRGLRVTHDGLIAVAVRKPTPALILVDPSTGSQAVVSSGGFLQSEANDVLEEPTGSFLVTGPNEQLPGPPPVANVTRIDRSSGLQSELTSGPPFQHPLFMDFDDSSHTGNIVVADDFAVALFHVNVTTGEREVISSGGMFVNPVGVLVDPVTGNYMVTDHGNSTLFEVNRITGQQTVFFAGSPLIQPKALALDLEGNYIVADDGADALFRIDRHTRGITMVTSVDSPGGVTVVVPEPSALGLLLLTLGAAGLPCQRPRRV